MRAMSAEERRKKKTDERRELAARVLFEAGFMTDVEAGAKFGVCERTVRKYRRQMDSDPLLAGLVAQKRREFERRWRGSLLVTPEGVADALDEIARELRKGGSVAPEAVESIAVSLRAAGDTLPSRKVVDTATRRERYGHGGKGPAPHKW